MLTSGCGAIAKVQAWATSFPVPPGDRVRMGVGRTLKPDAVVVKVTTDDGIVGWGESHHGRAHSSIAHFVTHALRPLVLGMDATDVQGVWHRINPRQLASHGIGAGCAIAMSGIDMALWDIRAKAAGWPLYKLLGGASKLIAAYAGGVALGWQDPSALVDEAAAHVRAGYKAVKLRLGDTVERDVARVAAVREAFGDDLEILTDVNAVYTLADARRAIPQLDELDVGWLEEPFPAHDYRSYELARAFGRVPFAAGENHYTRFEFSRLVDDRVVSILQPDLYKTGGVTETMRIAALASAYKLPIHPHSSMTGINMAATLHVLAAIDGNGYFEADVSRGNLFRDELTPTPFAIDADGCVRPSDRPGIGVEVDETFLDAHPAIEGPAYA
ncbi:MAG: mandelate racemase/muconate lactonizing enzyme family protein [Pseudomonas sp.]|uniref:mandelate racemase/muconate lactonizing enzyme family protein n=1 Tax=Pseudomonas sp. TaxID=306 RepID=UPI001202531F|nr:mandelate racemase/muconate lactonizing enzyme family protein [Pseudomonas sp.]RZI71202.1 MAG: mandelate racemase/muconate lactonizing enzyme family protein [Pseudomonas sp.]